MTRNEEIQKLIDEETGIDNFGGLDYQVGSVDCQECKFCYGHSDNNNDFLMYYHNGEKFVRLMPYIKCMRGLEQHSMCKRIQRLLYRIKYYFKYELFWKK